MVCEQKIKFCVKVFKRYKTTHFDTQMLFCRDKFETLEGRQAPSQPNSNRGTGKNISDTSEYRKMERNRATFPGI